MDRIFHLIAEANQPETQCIFTSNSEVTFDGQVVAKSGGQFTRNFQQYHFYLDEAGHTGNDLVKSDQLFFTMGAVGIPSKDAQAIETIIQTVKRKYQIDFELRGKSDRIEV